MKVLFLESHSMWIHGLPNGFRDAGHEVLISGPLTSQNLPLIIKDFSPDLIFSMGWGPENSSLQKQKWINKYIKDSKIPHVYWATEDPTHTKAFTLPFLKVVQPDFVFTICKDNVTYYNKLGIKSAHLDFGYHESVHCSTNIYDNYKGSLAVVANAYPNKLKIYENHYRHESLRILIKPLLYNNIKINFYGKYWNCMKDFLGKDIPEDWLHDYIPYEEANKIYSSNDIILGLQNNPKQLTQRTYEILASGGFLITNNTEEVNRLFSNKKDLVTSSSPEETLKLVQYYLNNKEERALIKSQGQITVRNHSYKNRADYIIDTLSKEGIFLGKKSNYKINLMESNSFIHENYELYTICNGDTLCAISRKFNVSVKEIMELNNLTSDMIDAGQLLKIRNLKTTSENKSSLLISKGNTNNKFIALTYDAGDGIYGTSHLLKILDKHEIKATFFLTGQWVEKHPDLSSQIANAGHEIGNHSYSHPDFTTITKAEMLDEIIKTEKIINETIDVDTKPLFRPPFGAWNRETLESIGEAGYQYSIYWSLDTIDWRKPPVNTIVDNVINNIQGDDIILMHLEYLNTAEATDIFIPKLKALGYEFVTITSLLK